MHGHLKVKKDISSIVDFSFPNLGVAYIHRNTVYIYIYLLIYKTYEH